MSINVKNARIVYDFSCPACGKGLILQNFTVKAKRSRHLTNGKCLGCKARLSIDYDKVRNEVVATVKGAQK